MTSPAVQPQPKHVLSVQRVLNVTCAGPGRKFGECGRFLGDVVLVGGRVVVKMKCRCGFLNVVKLST